MPRYVAYCPQSPDGYHHVYPDGIRKADFVSTSGQRLFGYCTGGYYRICAYDRSHILITENFTWGSMIGYWGNEEDTYGYTYDSTFGLFAYKTTKSLSQFRYENDNYITGYVIH